MSEETGGYPGAPPDWYPDPAGGPGKRWWDGYSWTEGVVLPTPPPSPPVRSPALGAPSGGAAPGPPPYVAAWPSAPPPGHTPTLVADELRMVNLARFAVAIPALYFAWDLVVTWSSRAQLKKFGHEYHQQIQAAQNGKTLPNPHLQLELSGAVRTIGGLITLATLAAVIIACIWQYRAAVTARALGRPAVHSPGWGIGSWFVPIVQLWMPYQAIRDLLEPGNPNRSLVGQWWLCLIGTWAFSLAAGISAFFADSVTIYFCLPGWILCVGIATIAPRIVTAVAASHQASLDATG